jgi:hypothetical protein
VYALRLRKNIELRKYYLEINTNLRRNGKEEKICDDKKTNTPWQTNSIKYISDASGPGDEGKCVEK